MRKIKLVKTVDGKIEKTTLKDGKISKEVVPEASQERIDGFVTEIEKDEAEKTKAFYASCKTPRERKIKIDKLLVEVDRTDKGRKLL